MADEDSHVRSTDSSVPGKGHSDPLIVPAEVGARLSTPAKEALLLSHNRILQALY